MAIGWHEKLGTTYMSIVHIHITSKISDARNLQAEMCQGPHFPPDMTPVMTSWVKFLGVRVLKCLGGT